jgi:hypothetical protein
MIKITFVLLDLQNGKRQRCSRKINRSEFLSWLDKEGQVETVKGKIVRLVDLQKHVFIQHV